MSEEHVHIHMNPNKVPATDALYQEAINAYNKQSVHSRGVRAVVDLVLKYAATFLTRSKPEVPTVMITLEYGDGSTVDQMVRCDQARYVLPFVEAKPMFISVRPSDIN